MNHLTLTEDKKVHEITQRLADLSSPVLRLQAILQFSQIVDMLALGDTNKELSDEYTEEINRLKNEKHEGFLEMDDENDRLFNELNALKGENTTD